MLGQQSQPKDSYQTTEKFNNLLFKQGSSIFEESNCIDDQFQSFQNYVMMDADKIQEKNNLVITKVPGESKNLPKNYGRRLQSLIRHIKNNTDDQQLLDYIESSDVQQFLDIHPEKIGKKQLEKFIKTKAGQIFASDFFGNLRWIYGLVKETKTNPEIYFRYNQTYFYEAQRAKG